MVMASALAAGLSAVIVAQRLVELRLARRNEAWLRQRGAREVGRSHYPLFFVLHTGWLVAWPIEAWLHGPSLGPGWPLWLAAFAVAELLRYWAIHSLGRRWNTRILVLPGEPLVGRGAYRFLAHPNYVAVVLELAAVPLVFGARWTALSFGALNLALLLGIRIPTEARALRTFAAASARAAPEGPEDRSRARGG